MLSISWLSLQSSVKVEFACEINRIDPSYSMVRNQVVSIIESGKPFKILMADNNTYDVPHADYISMPPRGDYVLVYEDQGKFFVLPLRTMTAIEVIADHASS